MVLVWNGAVKSCCWSQAWLVTMHGTLQVGSTLYKRALVTSQRADGIMEKGLVGKAEAMADYETAQEMLRQSIRCGWLIIFFLVNVLVEIRRTSWKGTQLLYTGFLGLITRGFTFCKYVSSVGLWISGMRWGQNCRAKVGGSLGYSSHCWCSCNS